MLGRQAVLESATAKAIGTPRGLALVKSIHRAITVRYIASLLAVGLLALSTWRLTASELTAHEDQDQTIGVAGAQRMLTHQMAGLLAERVATADPEQRARADKELRDAEGKFNASYKILTSAPVHGAPAAAATAELRHAYFDGPDAVAGAVARMKRNVTAIEDGMVDHQAAMALIAWMRGPLIHVLDTAVQAHRNAAHQSLEELKHRHLTDLILLLTVLMLEAAVVFEPLARRVRSQTDAILEQARQLAKLSAEMKELAITDGLTGLRNRRAFDLEVERLSAGQSLILADSAVQADPSQSGRHTPRVGIVLFDLDWFKQVNDQYGHDAGDAVLRTVGDRLRHLCRAQDFAARLGGDEFVVMLTDVSSMSYVASIAERLRKIVSEPVGYMGHTLRVGASIGYCVVPNDAASIQRAVGLADDALRADKQKKKVRYTSAFTGSLSRTLVEPEGKAA